MEMINSDVDDCTTIYVPALRYTYIRFRLISYASCALVCGLKCFTSTYKIS